MSYMSAYTTKEIISLAYNIREYYNSRNAIHIAETIGCKVSLMTSNLGFKGNVLCLPNYPTIITVNSRYTELSQNVIAAHELGHAILHCDAYNQFDTSADPDKAKREYEANLFAVALLFNQQDFNTDFASMNNSTLKAILDANIYPN